MTIEYGDKQFLRNEEPALRITNTEGKCDWCEDWHAYLYANGLLKTVCLHRHRSKGAARKCGDKMRRAW